MGAHFRILSAALLALLFEMTTSIGSPDILGNGYKLSSSCVSRSVTHYGFTWRWAELQLFLDDSKMKNFTSCFKDKKFLEFFFKRLKFNDTGKYQKEFPFLSPCGREKNFVRCDDLPIVFTHIFERTENSEAIEYMAYGHAGELLKVKFEPEKLCMLAESGRVYHPGPESTGGVGLVKSSLAIQLSHHFSYEDSDRVEEMPSHFVWKDKKYRLSNETVKIFQYLKTIKLK